MELIDYLVLMAYVVGVLAIGSFFGKQVKSSKDMFSAGGRSPWWVSGLSGFMTMFSAGTFVVWGGIAYKYGIVAMAINMCYGIAGLLVGFFVAGRWRKMGVQTPAEYIQLRFGKAAINLYTWTMIVYRMVGVAVALYSLAVILTALMPLGEGHFLRNETTGNLSLVWAILFFGTFMIVYTMSGGLWSVLMADVLQFIVLNLAVIFVVPLCFMHLGGLSNFAASVPEGFFRPVTSEYTWFFLAGWCMIHFFMVGAEWAFVQRFLCVPTATDARKSAWMFGVLYLISPWLWLLPPMLYRGIDPAANPEQAYILACQTVLPAGMLGMMLAAMVSATASMVSAQLNVFASVLTSDFYHGFFRPHATESHLVSVGRLMTVLLGIVIIVLAILVPAMGGAQDVIITVTSLLVGPLLAPSIWGLFSRKINQKSVWLVAMICFGLGIFVEFGLTAGGWFSNLAGFESIGRLIQEMNPRTRQMAIGVALPIILLVLQEFLNRRVSRGWDVIAQKVTDEIGAVAPVTSPLPALVVSCSLLYFGILMVFIAFINPEEWKVIAIFFGILFVLSGLLFGVYLRKTRQPVGREET